MSTYYDRRGRKIGMEELDRLLSDREYKIVGRSNVGDDATVSTVWLGIDHSFDPSTPPLIFETLVFGGGMDQYMRRYSTEEQARAGHRDVIARVKAEAADFASLVADPRIPAAVRVLESCMNAHTHEHWGDTGLDNGELYVRLARAVTA